LTPDNRQRKPSLVILGLIIRALRRLTGSEVDVGDILEYVAAADEAAWFNNMRGTPLISGENKTDSYGRASVDNPHEPRVVLVEPASESPELLEHVAMLTAERLKHRGFIELADGFVSYASEEAPSSNVDTRTSPVRRLVAGMVGALLLSLALMFVYERVFVQPRLLAARGGIFSFRDRLLPTSSLPLPTLIGPEGTIRQLAPVLRASNVPGAIAYEFYVKNLVSDDGVYTGPVSSSSFTIPEGTLCPNTPYEWRVRVLGPDGWSSFSSALGFTVSEETLDPSQAELVRLAQIRIKPETPVMLAPLGSTPTTTPILEVNPDPNVMGYGFYIRDLQTDSVIYIDNFAQAHRVQVPAGLLKDGGIYQWNTRARNCHYWSEFTPAQVFTVEVIR
jgi:hypothetical protein